MNEFAVEIETLRKQYSNGVEALAGVSLQVPYGCIFGLIGPNGAGKSTLVKSLLSILRPTECRGNMLGKPIGNKEVLAKVGYLPEHAQFPEYLSGRQVIEYAAGLSRLSRKSCRQRCDQLLEQVGMSKSAHRSIRTYSKGMKQRIGLAQALINDPTVVFLDEPTDGVDPQGRIDFKQIIVAMREEGRTVFVNSHLLAEVEQMADRVAILSMGHIIQQGLVSDLTRRDARYELNYLGELPESLVNWCRDNEMELNPGRIVLRANSAADVQKLIDQLRAASIVISGMKEERYSLEEFFLQAVTQSRKTSTAPHR